MGRKRCPNCGSRIPAKAEKCMYCGYEIHSIRKYCCRKCGSIVDATMANCPVCGCPKGSGVTENKVKKAFKIFMDIIFICLVISLGYMVYSYFYMYTTDEIVDIRNKSAGETEECSDLVLDVFYDAENYIYRNKTEEYTCPYGYFVDGESAVDNLYNDEEFKKDIRSIEKKRKKLRETGRILKLPPFHRKEYNEALLKILENDSRQYELLKENSTEYDERYKKAEKLSEREKKLIKEFHETEKNEYKLKIN